MTKARPPESEKRKSALSRELTEFLIELSIAVHRFAMYPVDHPSRLPASERVLSGLTGLLRDRPSLAIGVAERRLIVEGALTDEHHPVLSDLARRLHLHQLGGIVLSRGAALQEIEGLLGRLAVEGERGGRPIGLLSAERRPTWEHVRLVPVGYDRLALADGDKSPGRTKQLWVRLAEAALDGSARIGEALPTGRSLARVLAGKQGEEGYEKPVMGCMLHLTKALSEVEGPEAEEARRELSDLLGKLDAASLRRLLERGGTREERGRLLLHANEGGVDTGSVLKLLHAATGLDGQLISASLTRLLSKLAVHAEQGSKAVRTEAEAAIRRQVAELLADWDLDDPNPDTYTRALDRMARAAPGFEVPSKEGSELAGAERVLQMALEVDAFGPIVQQSVRTLLEEGKVEAVLEILEGAAPGCRAAVRVRDQAMTPEQLRRVLSEEEADEGVLRLLVDGLGTRAIEPLFGCLKQSDSGLLRGRALELLAGMGDPVGEIAAAQLSDERWFVKRNMLVLLQKLETLPERFGPLIYLQHPDPRVRREALPLALRRPALRDRVLATALADDDERVVRMALLEVQEELPEALTSVVVNRILRSEAHPMLRTLAVRALGSARSPQALETLVAVCSDGRDILRRLRLARKSPELLAAISALARNWHDEAQAGALLSLARNSKDLQIRAAARSGAVPL